MSVIMPKRKEECEDVRCRLCMSFESAEISIFDEEEAIHHLLQFTMNIEVDVTEKHMPLNICLVCLKKLKEYAEFKINCEVTQKRLELEWKKKCKTKKSKRKYTKGLKKSLASGSNDFQSEGEKQKITRKGACKCTRCNLVFANKEESSEHRKICRNQAVICDICGQTVKQSYITQHRQRHTKTLNFECQSCEYKTYSKDLLKKHSRIHQGIRPYSCEFCEATFMFSSNYTKHKRRHYEKQFQCEFCERLYVDNSELRRHINETHSNPNKVYRCSSCDRVYANRKQQRKHERKFHNAPALRAGKTPTYILLQRENNVLSQQETLSQSLNINQQSANIQSTMPQHHPAIIQNTMHLMSNDHLFNAPAPNIAVAINPIIPVQYH